MSIWDTVAAPIIAIITGAVDTWVVYATAPISSWFTAAPDLIGFSVGAE